MKLSRLEPYQYFGIKTPIWNGGTRVVGLNESMMKLHNKIEILYVRKDGTRSYPDVLYFNQNNLSPSYKRQVVGGGVRLVWIPIHDLEPLEAKVSTPPRMLNEEEIKELHPNVYELFFNKQERLL